MEIITVRQKVDDICQRLSHAEERVKDLVLVQQLLAQTREALAASQNPSLRAVGNPIPQSYQPQSSARNLGANPQVEGSSGFPPTDCKQISKEDCSNAQYKIHWGEFADPKPASPTDTPSGEQR